jgi:hypothetical protein
MPKIGVVKKLLAIMLVIFISMSGNLVAAANPYPALANGGTRHHIIPNGNPNDLNNDWLSGLGYRLFIPNADENLNQDQQDQLHLLIQALTDNQWLNQIVLQLGAYAPPNQQPGGLWAQLEEDVINAANVEAREVLQDMIAWIPGNLVVGPQNRPNDPGNHFDFCAMMCRTQLNNNYPNYNPVWMGNDDQQKRNAIIVLARMGIENEVAMDAACWRLNQGEDACGQ